jgi:hypothetical protein
MVVRSDNSVLTLDSNVTPERLSLRIVPQEFPPAPRLTATAVKAAPFAPRFAKVLSSVRDACLR